MKYSTDVIDYLIERGLATINGEKIELRGSIYRWLDGNYHDAIEAIDLKYAAEKVEEAALDWQDYHKNKWGKGSAKPDQSMVIAGESDATDMRKIAHYLRNNDLKSAMKAYRDLDTIVREEIYHIMSKLGSK